VTRVGGIVLCGGRSSRMGRPKAWLPVGDELMLQRVVRVLAGVVSPVVVVAAPGQDVPPLPGDVDVARDETEGRGPLAGLAAGLAALEGQADAAYLSACDVPLLVPGFVRRVIERLAGESLIAVPRGDGYFHPLAAAYSLAVRDTVMSLLAADRLRPAFLFDALPTRVIEPHELADVDPTFQSLRNLNTPDEYEAVLRQLAGQPV
jgi:molybdopterin-guanine dinucleotide biosynthesis protein A